MGSDSSSVGTSQVRKPYLGWEQFTKGTWADHGDSHNLVNFALRSGSSALLQTGLTSDSRVTQDEVVKASVDQCRQGITLFMHYATESLRQDLYRQNKRCGCV